MYGSGNFRKGIMLYPLGI